MNIYTEHRAAYLPCLDVRVGDEGLDVDLEVPGVVMDDLSVTVEGGELVLAGSRRPPTGEKAVAHHLERRFGEFRRVVQLPFEVEVEAVQARLVDGVLHVHLPKAAAVRPRRITVSAN